jgi:putative tricarboxylic transport membrane protein
VQRTDRWVGIALALLGLAVLWSAQAFPNVPGQKLGAGFLPMIVGAGLVLCAIGLIVRSLRQGTTTVQAVVPRNEHFGSALVIIATVVGYLLLAERLGFLIVAPLCLVAIFRALRVGWTPSLWWAIGGTVVVHLAFYKLLRVPLPWGVLRPFY